MKYNIVTAAELLRISSNVKYLYRKIWKEYTLCMLHGPREANKSARAVDIACELAVRNIGVLYVNVDGNFADYCYNLGCMSLSVFNPGLGVGDDKREYADVVLDGIEEFVKTNHVHTVIVDSVSRIAALSFGRNSSVAYVMKRLAVMQMRYDLSVLAVVHDTTKAAMRTLLNYASSEIIEEPVQPAADAKTDAKTKDKPEKPAAAPASPSGKAERPHVSAINIGGRPKM